MKKILLLIMALCVFSVSAFAEGESFYCNIGTGEDCVSLHLPKTDLNEAFCEKLEGKEVPSVPGAEFWVSMPEKDERCEDVTPVPEFTTIGAGIALAGSIGAYFKAKKAKK